jgi:hypothetical protein
MGQQSKGLQLQKREKTVLSVTTKGQTNVAQTALWDKTNYIFLQSISMSVL